MKTQTTDAWPFPKIMPGAQPIANDDADFEEVELDFPELNNFTTAFLVSGLNSAMKNYRFELMESAKEQDIGIVHIFNDGEKGGLTVAYKVASKYGTGRMVQVAVATCSVEDHFNKKVGTVVALEKFFDGETIELPILKSYMLDNLSYAVKTSFTAFYSVI